MRQAHITWAGSFQKKPQLCIYTTRFIGNLSPVGLKTQDFGASRIVRIPRPSSLFSRWDGNGGGGAEAPEDGGGSRWGRGHPARTFPHRAPSGMRNPHYFPLFSWNLWSYQERGFLVFSTSWLAKSDLKHPFRCRVHKFLVDRVFAGIVWFKLQELVFNVSPLSFANGWDLEI